MDSTIVSLSLAPVRETQSEITARARATFIPVGGLSAQLSDAINQSYSRLALLELM